MNLRTWFFHRRLVDRARDLSPFSALAKSTAESDPCTSWFSYKSREHGVSLRYPSGWHVHLENAILDRKPCPWMEAVVFVGGQPPNSYLAFHVSLRRQGVFDGNWKLADGSEGPVSTHGELTVARRNQIVPSFHSLQFLDERDVTLAGLGGHVLSYRHFGLKKLTSPLETAVWEHSCLLCGEGITYDVIIECSETLVEDSQRPLQFVLDQMSLPKKHETRRTSG